MHPRGKHETSTLCQIEVSRILEFFGQLRFITRFTCLICSDSTSQEDLSWLYPGIYDFELLSMRNAQLVVLKAKGRDAYDAAIALSRAQVNALAAGFSSEELTAAGRVMQALRARLEQDAG